MRRTRLNIAADLQSLTIHQLGFFHGRLTTAKACQTHLKPDSEPVQNPSLYAKILSHAQFECSFCIANICFVAFVCCPPECGVLVPNFKWTCVFIIHPSWDCVSQKCVTQTPGPHVVLEQQCYTLHTHTSLRRLGHSSTCAAQPPSHFHKASRAAPRKTTGSAE